MNYSVRECIDIEGCREWILDHVRYGQWLPYYINFMFEPLPGSPDHVVAQMHKAIFKFYGRFSTRFVRNPHASYAPEILPRLWLFPDKQKYGSSANITELKFNAGGIHFNGPLLISVFGRSRRCPIELIKMKQGQFARHGISRIHVKRMTDADGLADYAGKTVKWGRVEAEHSLYLPRPSSELRSSSTAPLSAAERHMKDLQAAHNLSAEAALALLDRQNS